MRHLNLLNLFCVVMFLAAGLFGCSKQDDDSPQATSNSEASTRSTEESFDGVTDTASSSGTASRSASPTDNRTGEEPAESSTKDTRTTEAATPDQRLAAAESSVPNRRTPPATQTAEPAPLSMPQVVMSEGHAATCLVHVGDQFPTETLNDPSGQPHTLSDLYGTKLTVVLFWDSPNPYSLAELRDLALDVFGPLAQQGVAVVGVSVGNDGPTAQQAAAGAGATFPLLIDMDRALFQQVATAKLPRTYLLDATGKVLWFDMQYTRSTNRDLMQAIQFKLAETP